MARPERLEVFKLDQNLGALIGEWGARPCVVVSHDFFNRVLNTVAVVTLTTTDRSNQAGCVQVKRGNVSGGRGLEADSFAVCHSPITVPQDALGERLGVVTKEVGVAIDHALAFALELGPDPEDEF